MEPEEAKLFKSVAKEVMQEAKNKSKEELEIQEEPKRLSDLKA